MYGNGAGTGTAVIQAVHRRIRRERQAEVPVCCAAALGTIMIIIVVPLSATVLILTTGTTITGSVLRRSNYPIALFLSYPFTLCLEENV